MKSFRWTIVSILVVVGLVAFTIYDNKRSAEKAELTDKENSVIKFPIEELTRVEFINRQGLIALERVPNGRDWRLVEPLKDSADQQTVLSLLSSLASEKIVQEVVAGESIALETYGLHDPVTRLKIYISDGKRGVKSEEIKIGSVKAYDSNLYAQIDQEKRVLLLSSAWDGYLAKRPNEFRDKHLVRQDFKDLDIKRILISPEKAPEIELTRVGEHWQMSKGGVAFPILDERVNQFIDQIKGVRLLHFLEAESAKVAKQKLEAPTMAVRFFKENKSPIVNVRFSPESDRVVKGRPAAQDMYAMSSDLTEVVSVSKTLVETIEKSDQDFYDKRKPFSFTTTEAQKLLVEAKEFKGQFEKKAGVWSLLGHDEKKEADSDKVNELLAKLSKMEAVRVLGRVKGAPGLKDSSRLVITKADGSLIFELAWGEPVTEKVKNKPEAKFRKARTNLSEFFIGLPDGEIKNFSLQDLVRVKLAKATTQAATASGAKSPTPPPATP